MEDVLKRIKEDLPKNFTYINYKVVRGNIEFRIKEVIDGTTAQAWLEEYSKKSFTTWRVLKTYPNTGKRNIYRKDFRCQHFTDRRASGTGKSKNTNCPAKLEVIIKRYVEKSKAKNVDTFVKDYPAVIVMKGDHNHPIFSEDTIEHMDILEEKNEVEITEKEKELFFSFVSNIENGLKSNPEVFKPAFKKMVNNIEKFVTTQSGLVSTMYTLGTYTGLARINSKKPRVAKKITRRCHKNKGGVQPTSIGRRKLPLSGKRKGNESWPSKSNVPPKEHSYHEYTAFGMLTAICQ